MGIRGGDVLGGGLLYALGGAEFAPTVPFEALPVLRFIHVLGERGGFNGDAVLIQLCSKFLGAESSLPHTLKSRIKSADSIAERHTVVAFERLFLILKVGKFRQNLADSFGIGRHNVFFPFDVFFTSG